MRHPLRDQTFTLLPSGLIQVEDHASGKSGKFHPDGRWVSGPLKFADRAMLCWVSRTCTAETAP